MKWPVRRARASAAVLDPASSSGPALGAVGTVDVPLATPAPAGAVSARRRRPLPTAVPIAAASALYLAISAFAYRFVLADPASRLPGCACGDQVQEVWFLRWPLYALEHGINPFFSRFMDFPQGFNLEVNTTSPFLSLVSAPVQIVAGSTAAYDLLLVVSLAASALAMCLALRHWVRSWPAAFVGGLMYGFSPYMIGQGLGHLFLVAAFVPPIVLVLLDDIVVAQRHRAWRDGLLLALLVVVQYFISPEVLAMTAVVGGCGVALVALTHPATVAPRVAHACAAFGVAALVAGACLAYPVWTTLAGPQHVVGAPHPLSQLAFYPGDLLGPVLPTHYQVLAPAALQAHGSALTGTDVTENGMYLGLPLLVIVSVLTWVYRRARAMVLAYAMAIVSGILALGPTLVVNTHSTGVPLPFRVLTHVPLVRDILPVRFSLFLQLFAAASLAIGLDLAARRCGTHARRAGAARPPVLAAVLGALALLPLVPDVPYPAAATDVPAYFSSAAAQAIPAGSPVLAYPYPHQPGAEEAMLGQVVSGLRFALIGGNAFVPGPAGTSIETPTPLHPSVVERLFDWELTPSQEATAEALQSHAAAPIVRPPRIDTRTVGALRTFLRRYRVSTVIVEPVGSNWQGIDRYVRDAVGPGALVGGIEVWSRVQTRLVQHGHT